MPMLDTFNSDAFGVVSLTTALEKMPYEPNWLGSMGLFQPRGITTTSAVVEERHGVLSLVPTSARGTNTTTKDRPDRVTRSFLVPHLAKTEGVLAEDVQNVRAFGSENAVETVAGLVNDRMNSLRMDIEATKEKHRHGAIQGDVLDDDGSVIYNYFTEFGVSEQTVDFVLSAAGTDIKGTCATVVRNMHTALGGAVLTGIIGLAGNTWWDAFVSHDEVKTAYERFQDGHLLRSSQMGPQFFTGPDGQEGFLFAGIQFFNSRSGLGGTPYIADGVCRFFPTGVQGMFQEIHAPADYIETVNTMGLAFYAKQERMPMDKGISLEVQANPLLICTRPRGLVEGTQS